jgi:cobalamin biosynthesis protein CobD/CbiB
VVNVLIELFSVSIIVLILAILLDIIVGDPSPTSPWAFYYKLHPTVLIGNYTKALERRLKNPNPRREKLNGVLLGLAVIFTFTLPVFFGLWAIFIYLGAIWTWLGIIVYAIVGIVLLKFTVCIKLETDWAKAWWRQGNILISHAETPQTSQAHRLVQPSSNPWRRTS